MLQQYLDGVKNRAPSPFVGALFAETEIREAFDESIAVLKDPRFPDPRIQLFARTASRILDEKRIPVLIQDEGPSLPRVAFENGPETAVLLPDNLHHETQNDPIFQLGGTLTALHNVRLATRGMHARLSLHERLAHQAAALEADMILAIGGLILSGEVETHAFHELQHLQVIRHTGGYEGMPAEMAWRGREVTPIPPLTPEQMDLVADFDYEAVTSESGPSLIHSTYRLIEEGGFAGLQGVERLLGALNHPVFLYATELPEGLTAVDPIARTKQPYAFSLARVGINPLSDPQHVFEELGTSYEESFVRLARAGMPQQ